MVHVKEVSHEEGMASMRAALKHSKGERYMKGTRMYVVYQKKWSMHDAGYHLSIYLYSQEQSMKPIHMQWCVLMMALVLLHGPW